jgi:two-component system NtrC family sensor kinase
MAVQPRQPAFTPTYTSLAALSAVASGLNSGVPPEDAIPRILDVVREQLRAEECVLWLREDGGYRAGWSSGTQLTPPTVVAAAMGEVGAPGEAVGAALDSALSVAPLESTNGRLGALSLRREQPLVAEERLLMVTLANFLSPFLTGAEQSRRLAAEVALRTRQIEEQRRFTSLIIDSLPVGLYVVDDDYRIQAWNRKRETGMQGVAREEAMGRPIFEILHRQDPDELRAEFDQVFDSGKVQQFHTESTAFGEPRVYRVSKIPMRLEGNRVSHVITIGEDISEWKEAMDRMSQADKLAAIGQLAAGVMHEINNPLATIAACSESLTLLVEDMRAIGYAMNKQFAEYLGIIESEVQRCKRIVDGLLEFSHPRSLTKETILLDDVIEQSLFLVKHHAKFKKMNVTLELSAAAEGTVAANRDQLIQVFMALLLNAVDAMGETGRLTVRTRRARVGFDAVVAEVVDEGHGIPRGEVQKIFEPFYTTKAPGRGTGLGLSICYAIVTEHGGRIEVDSVPGTGSVFRVILPVATA